MPGRGGTSAGAGGPPCRTRVSPRWWGGRVGGRATEGGGDRAQLVWCRHSEARGGRGSHPSCPRQVPDALYQDLGQGPHQGWEAPEALLLWRAGGGGAGAERTGRRTRPRSGLLRGEFLGQVGDRSSLGSGCPAQGHTEQLGRGRLCARSRGSRSRGPSPLGALRGRGGVLPSLPGAHLPICPPAPTRRGTVPTWHGGFQKRPQKPGLSGEPGPSWQEDRGCPVLAALGGR